MSQNMKFWRLNTKFSSSHMQSVFLGILILYCMLNIYRTLAFKWVWVGRLINYIHSMFNHEMSHWLLIYVIFKNKNCPIMSNLVSNQTSRLLQCCLKIDARMINGFCKLLIREEHTTYRISIKYVFREDWEVYLLFCFATQKHWIIFCISGFYDPMKMKNDIREDM